MATTSASESGQPNPQLLAALGAQGHAIYVLIESMMHGLSRR